MRDENEIKLERLETAKLLITCEDASKKPHLLVNNKQGKKPYLLALEQYEECRQRLKEKEESVERVNKTKKVRNARKGSYDRNSKRFQR